MRITNTIITVLLCITNACFCQDDLKNVFEISFDVGFSNMLSSSNSYSTFTGVGSVILESKNGAIKRNTTLSFTRFLGERHGLKFLFGRSKYGFDFEGTITNSNMSTKGSYGVTYLEWGISYVHKIPISNFTNLLLEPGLRYHSDARFQSQLLSFSYKDSFSASSYVGFEIPMTENVFFVNFGFQFKIPLERYNRGFIESEPSIRPIFIGLKVAVNFRF